MSQKQIFYRIRHPGGLIETVTKEEYKKLPTNKGIAVLGKYEEVQDSVPNPVPVQETIYGEPIRGLRQDAVMLDPDSFSVIATTGISLDYLNCSGSIPTINCNMQSGDIAQFLNERVWGT